jgi:2-polyprenyl-3-methyl-5-hydroxy-6-metoxy-1,4-benzoquinol methylase
LTPSSKGLKVLEIGAGYGATLSYLKEKNIAEEVVGVDIPSNKGTSPFKNIDQFFYEDIEKFEFKQYEGYFDYIILADVLEHLIHPREVLEKMQHLLKDEGEVLISIPNIRHWKGVSKVFLKGDFTYEESGLFDYTHLRFFCKKNIKELVEKSGFQISKIVSSIKIYKKRSPSKILNAITFGIFEEFLSVQYLVSAKRS